MRIIGLFTIILFSLLAAGLAAAAPSVGTPALTFNGNATPTFIHPTDTHPLTIVFSLSDSNYALEQTVQVNIALNTDNSFGGETILTFNETQLGTYCASTDLVAGTNCTVSWNGPGTSGSGAYYVVVQANVNETTASTPTASTTYLDKDAPAFSTAPSLSNTAWTNQPVDLNAACSDASNPGSACTLHYKLGSNAYQPFTSPYLFNSGSGTLLVKTIDTALNESGEVTLTLKIDTTAPTGSITSAPAPNENGYINTGTPVFHIAASDAGGSELNNATFAFKIDGTAQSISFSGSAVDYTPTTALSEGLHTAVLDINDHAGNALASVSFNVRVDTAAPSAPSGLDDSDVTSDSVVLTWSTVSDSGSGTQNYSVYQSTGTDSSAANSIGTVVGTTMTANGLNACATYSFWVRARDNVGNLSGFSGIVTITTSGCSTNTNNTNDNSSNSSDSGSGSGSSSGGSTSGACNVSFAIPTDVYAGEIIAAKATSSSTYTAGKFRVTPQGKATFYISQATGTATKWEGPYTIPSEIGLSLAFRFGANECGTASTTRIVKDPADKASNAPAASNSNANSGSGNSPALNAPAATAPSNVEPVSMNVLFSAEKIPEMLSLAGFNADGEKTIHDLLAQLNAAQTVKVIKNQLGKYEIHLILSFTNAANAGELKIIESVPKSFASTVDQFTVSTAMTTLKDDPLVQFTLSDLTEGQAIAIELVSKTLYETVETANAAAAQIQEDGDNPPLLFVSGTAKPAPGTGNLLAGFSGLASSATGAAPLVIGFLGVVGLILVSVRVVRGSVEGSDNPILRSSSQAGSPRSERVAASPVRGKKLWSSGEVRIGDDEE